MRLDILFMFLRSMLFIGDNIVFYIYVYGFSLNKGESMQVVCNQCDLTGTWVQASKRVAVFAGGEFTRVSLIAPPL